MISLPPAQEALRNYVFIELLTDKPPDGDKNAKLQDERFGTIDLPLYVILSPDGKELRRLAHRRVVDALVGFDAATIATTHQFCSLVLDSLGVAGDSDSRARLVEDLEDLVRETVDDLYLRAFAL